MSPADQQRYLEDLDFTPVDGDRITNEEQRAKHAKKYAKLLTLPLVNDALDIAAVYVAETIPLARKLEAEYWSVTCLPHYPKTDLYLRINLNWQMTFNIAYRVDEESGQPSLDCAWELPREFAVEIFENPLDEVIFEFIDLYNIPNFSGCVLPSFLVAGHPDQVTVTSYSAESALNLLNTEMFLYACRVFNLHLMRRGKVMWRTSHCYDLADELL